MPQATNVTIRASRPPTDRQAYAMPALGRKPGLAAVAACASSALQHRITAHD